MQFTLTSIRQKGLRWLLYMCLTAPIVSLSATELDSREEDSWTDNVFAAVSLGAGYNEEFRVNSNLEINEDYVDFWFLNVELFANWKGLFIELPGRSQRRVDGQYSGNAIGYNFYNSEHWAYDIYALRSSGNQTRDFANPERTLRLYRETDYRLGFRATGFYDNLFTQFIFTPHSFRDDIGGVEASASLRYNWQYKNLIIYKSIGARYRSADINDYYFGLDAATANDIAILTEEDPNADNIADFFSPYDSGSGVGLHGELGFEYPLTEHVVFGGFFQYSVAPDSVKDSPLFLGDSVRHSFALSVTYVF